MSIWTLTEGPGEAVEGDCDLVLTMPYGPLPKAWLGKPMIISGFTDREDQYRYWTGSTLIHIGTWGRAKNQSVWVANMEPFTVELADLVEDGISFPYELPLRLLKAAGAKGVVADPFMGRGTTGAACRALGLDFLGNDRNPSHVEWAREYLPRTPLTIACVNSGDYCGRGEEYVKVLRDMIRRNLEIPFRFVCLTDAPIEGVECIVRPDLPQNWWAKLQLFREFTRERVLYFDLDTIITGALEPFAMLRDPFVMLRDFYYPDCFASGVMSWEGDYSYLADIKAGDDHPMGDGGWIASKLAEKPVAFQDLFPETVLSYKGNDLERAPTGDAAIICFHGLPRPHEVAKGWVPEFWKIGGLMRPRLIGELNNSVKAVVENVAINAARVVPMWTDLVAAHARPLVICGGGPSLADSLQDIRMLKAQGAEVWTLNGVHDYFVTRGLLFDGCVMLDSRAESAQFVQHPQNDVTYYLASQCPPAAVDAVLANKKAKIMLWTAQHDAVPTRPAVHGGSTVGLRALCLAYALGYRDIHMFGYDSSYADGANHAYKQPMNDSETTLLVKIDEDEFLTARWMLAQANEFVLLVPALIERGMSLSVYGTGLIPRMIKGAQTPK